MDHFVKILNGWKSLIIFVNSTIIDTWQDPKYSPVYSKQNDLSIGVPTKMCFENTLQIYRSTPTWKFIEIETLQLLWNKYFRKGVLL